MKAAKGVATCVEAITVACPVALVVASIEVCTEAYIAAFV